MVLQVALTVALILTANNNEIDIELINFKDRVHSAEPLSFEARISGSSSGDNCKLHVTARMPHHQHGLTYVPLVDQKSSSVYEIKGLAFQMKGYWEVYFDWVCGGRTVRAQTSLEVT